MTTIRETLDGLRGGGRGWTLLFVAAGWLFISGFRIVLPALLPQIKSDFAVDNASAGFALTVLWMTYAALQFPAGVVADRTGERNLLIGGALLGAVSFGLFYLVPVFALFLVVCGVFGVGAGLFGTPRDMFLSRTFPESDNTAYGVTFAAGSLGAATLPYVGTLVAGRWGWRLAVGWLLPLLLLVGVGLWWATPVPSSSGSSVSSESSVSADYPISERLPPGRTVRLTLRTLTDRWVLLASTAMILFVFTYQALLSFLPTYLVEVKNIDQGLSALLFGLLFVAGTVVQPVAGHAADRIGERTVVLTLIGVATVTVLALPFAEGVVWLSVLVPLVGVRIAIGPLTSAFIVRELPVSIRGTGWGFLRTVFFGIGATGSSVVGVFADAGLFDAAFVFLAGLTGATAAFWLAITG
jgi:MFS family permease